MSNERKLLKLVKAKDVRLRKVPPSTLRGHALGERDLGKIAKLLLLYERCGMPIEGWCTKKGLAELDEVAPLPVPDKVYDVGEPS